MAQIYYSRTYQQWKHGRFCFYSNWNETGMKEMNTDGVCCRGHWRTCFGICNWLGVERKRKLCKSHKGKSQENSNTTFFAFLIVQTSSHFVFCFKWQREAQGLRDGANFQRSLRISWIASTKKHGYNEQTIMQRLHHGYLVCFTQSIVRMQLLKLVFDTAINRMHAVCMWRLHFYSLCYVTSKTMLQLVIADQSKSSIHSCISSVCMRAHKRTSPHAHTACRVHAPHHTTYTHAGTTHTANTCTCFLTHIFS